MIEYIPVWINVLFILAWATTVAFFYYANGKPKRITLLILIWSLVHAVLAHRDFYQITTDDIPRFALVMIPVILTLIWGLMPQSQRWVANNRDTRISTFSHIIRIPVEIVLYGLLLHKMVPELMTFEGRNFDVLIGISAIFIGYLHLSDRLSQRWLIIWNVVGLAFVIFIFANGLLSAELPFQMFAFDQPNKAVTHFPFVMLPATVVPIVIWTHLTDIVLLMKGNNEKV